MPTVHHLHSVDGDLVFDLDPGVVTVAAGAVRVAESTTVDEAAWLARACTYEHAVFEQRTGGAAVGIRPRLLDSHDETMTRFGEEIGPLVADRRFVPHADLGSHVHDFCPGLVPAGSPAALDGSVDGVPLAEAAAGRAVAGAIGAWLGRGEDLAGITVAIEGLGTAGSGVAREVIGRGGTVVAVSTLRGAIARAGGFDLQELLEARAEHGERFVGTLGAEVHLPHELHGLAVDVLVPGARVGVYDVETAGRVQADLVAPAAYCPYTAAGLDVLRRRGVVALPDFVTAGGATVARATPAGLPASEVVDAVARRVAERIDDARRARMDPFDHAALLADTFLATWVPAVIRPDGPPMADRPLI